MTTCYAQPYAPAAEQKGSSPVSDQQPEGVYVHLLLKYIFLQRDKSGSVCARDGGRMPALCTNTRVRLVTPVTAGQDAEGVADHFLLC